MMNCCTWCGGQANPAGVVRTLASINKGPLSCPGGPGGLIVRKPIDKAVGMG